MLPLSITHNSPTNRLYRFSRVSVYYYVFFSGKPVVNQCWSNMKSMNSVCLKNVNEGEVGMQYIALVSHIL